MNRRRFVLVLGGVAVVLAGALLFDLETKLPEKSTSTSVSESTTQISTSSTTSSTLESSSISSSSTAVSVTLQQIMSRIVTAKVYQGGVWTLKNETPETVGNALAELQPTYVSELLAFNSNESISQQQIGDFNTIKRIVLKSSPYCKFDAFIYANQYSSANELTSQMEAINSAISPDLWYVDFWDNTYQSSPDMISAAIKFAHSNDQPIGGNCWGTQCPPNSDFIGTDDLNFTFRSSFAQLVSNYPSYPTVLHVNNNPQNGPSTESAVFIDQYTTQQRISYINSMAQSQKKYGYSFMYPVFFPNYPGAVSYDALADDSILSGIKSTMNQYNPYPYTS